MTCKERGRVARLCRIYAMLSLTNRSLKTFLRSWHVIATHPNTLINFVPHYIFKCLLRWDVVSRSFKPAIVLFVLPRRVSPTSVVVKLPKGLVNEHSAVLPYAIM